MPTYPGDPVVDLKPKIEFKNAGYNVLSLSMGTHSGTHIDVPLHIFDEAISVEKLPLDNFVGEAIFVEIIKNENEEITLEDIEKINIKEGDIFIIRTGWEKNKYKENYFKSFPYFSIETADYLISKKIKAIGADIPTVDGPQQNALFHKKVLSSGIIIIEALVNLKQTAGKRMFFSALPLNIKDADGSPVRAIAFEL